MFGAMQSSRREVLYIAITMIISFSASLGWMMWRSKAQSSSLQEHPMLERTRSPALIVQKRPASPAPRLVDPVPQAQAQVTPIQSVAAPGSAPVSFTFQRTFMPGAKVDWEGRLVNNLDVPLSLDLAWTSRDGNANLHVPLQLAAHGTRDFGSADGLQLRREDQIRVTGSGIDVETQVGLPGAGR
jgi:hypothetical protein